MAKTEASVLLEEICDEFRGYLRSGKICLDSFYKKIDPTLNINDIDRLLRIHFVLTEDRNGEKGVINFVKDIPKHLRRIKTSVQKRPDIFEDEIKGRINWQTTFIERNKKNPKNKNLFVCDRIDRNYDISENLVLKKILSEIYSIVYYDLKPAIDNNYLWIKDWSEDKQLKHTLKNVFFKNIYIRRIKSAEEISLSDRTINKVMNSRKKIYRDAAKLLARYRKLMNYDLHSEEAKELLRNTFIQPERTEVLFELYWIFKIIQEFQKKAGDVRFNIIDGTNNIVAYWEDEKFRYRIFHNSIGSLQFWESLKEAAIPKDDGFFVRESIALKKWEILSEEFFNLNKLDSLWGGRPDIILEISNIQSNKIFKVLIGEVKYTDNINYAAEGLRELLEYVSLVKEKQMYLLKKEEIFKSDNVIGYLFVDKVDYKSNRLDNIHVIKFGDTKKEGWFEPLNLDKT